MAAGCHVIITCLGCAQEHGLDAERLLDSSSYKETYRRDMIRWGEERRDRDPAHFCRLATAEADKPVWLVCDARRPTDMDYFTSHYPTLTVKVCASEDVRKERGWVWTDGVDNAPSECALDDYSCQMLLSNNGDNVMLTQQLEQICDLAFSKLKL
ncbi:Phosphomevalonate kinase [Geodia barretti]|uniref:Phosphomevalonate kinase n=1 Tax=Geodia barretti TaxID=519541 RepID=A0AA35S339_GEOBA|nr:Phosphomevalonate kinase [Geodia barretti]